MAEKTEQEQAVEAAAAAAREAEEAEDAAAAAEDEEFDRDRALATIKKQREAEAAAKKRAQELEAELQQFKDRDLSEQEKAAKAAVDAEKRASAAERAALQLEVALDKAPEGMQVAQIRKLAKRLTGTTREEFEADADELFADFAPSGEGEPPRGRPKERLRPGAVPGAKADEDDTPGLARLQRAYAKQ